VGVQLRERDSMSIFPALYALKRDPSGFSGGEPLHASEWLGCM